ncbi:MULTISPECIES: DUF5615 family PIN-like protein [unclassified Picosynechococcus]|uniref:DUF5615 family PIN-like protein n=1 Tax=unclassified Picosynechococcus TaxID=3079910 RepID=UPI0004AB1FFD|nr:MULTISPECIES: DUF5615 family PIN-like protein [unclassified Picosynechococcus]ANV88589.1 hypothetical protein AWQ22_14630 [Picosynechococcus sp. PCC 7117]
MKFLADMGISPKTVRWLRNQGHDAIHLLEQGLEKLTDAQILEKARQENRIILTVDLDFGTLLALSKAKLPSVVIFRLGNASREVIEDRLAFVLEQCSTELRQGVAISVDDEKVRLRSLPM